ncbi:TetR/AcrR family transcriptional regulator [Streptomyces sp. Inha503]|uniref:TetR/AcrR family transcriptional regulator n=1 Tax=Streptomyces sp. Inha503 TaxID=3383314 RepID=UPI0039A3B570
MPKVVDRQARRREIAEALLDIVAESGTNAVTFRAVADRSGWSTGVLGHYFKNRDDLLLGGLRRASEIAAERQRAISRTMVGRQSVEAILEEELPLDRRRLALTRIFVFFYAEAATDSAVMTEIDGYLAAWRRQTARAVRAAQQLGDLDPTLDADAAAADLVALTDGLSIHAIFNQSSLERLRRGSPIREWVNRLAPGGRETGTAVSVPGRTWAIQEEDDDNG